MEWEHILQKYKTYFNDISQKQRMAHQVAHRILGSSYQLEFTIDYMKYKEDKEKEVEKKESNVFIPTEVKIVKRKRKKKKIM